MMKLSRISVIAVLASLILSAGTVSAQAWSFDGDTDDFGSYRSFAYSFFSPDYGQFNYLEDIGEESLNDTTFFSLVVRCQDSELEVYSLWTEEYFIGGTFDERSSIQVRFNGGSATKWNVSYNNDGDGIFFGSPKTLVSKLLKAKTFAYKAYSYNGYVSANFSTANLAAARTSMKKAGCKI